MLRDLGLVEFIDKTASNDPVPGGGSIAALSGAISSALAVMVANLTIGKKKYVEVEADMVKVKELAETYKNEFVNLIDEDAKAFDLVMAGFKLPKETDEEKLARKNAIQDGLKEAARVPYMVAEKAFEIMELSEKVVVMGNSNAVTDGMVSAMMARTAVLSAILNVKINLSSIKDESFVTEYANKIEILEKKAIEKERAILEMANL